MLAASPIIWIITVIITTTTGMGIVRCILPITGNLRMEDLLMENHPMENLREGNHPNLRIPL
jgi:hypothetical protein